MRRQKWLTAGFLLLNLAAHVHVASAADNCHDEGSLFDCSNASSDWTLQGDWGLTDGSGGGQDNGANSGDGDNQSGNTGNDTGDGTTDVQQDDGSHQGQDGNGDPNADHGDGAGNNGGQDGVSGPADQESGDHGEGSGHGRGNTVTVSVNGLHDGAWSLALAPVEDAGLYTYTTGSLSEPSITVAAANKDVWVSFSDGALYGVGQYGPDPALCPVYFWSEPASNPLSQPAYYYASEPGMGACENRAASTGQILLPSSGLGSIMRLYSGDSIRIPKWQTQTLNLTGLVVEVAHLTELPANQTFTGTLVVTVSG